MPIEHGDLHAQSLNTKFGPNPFDDKKYEIVKMYQSHYPKIDTRHPANFQPTVGASPVEQTTKPEEGTISIFLKKPRMMKLILPKRLENMKIAPLREKHKKTPESSPNTTLQEEPINISGEKYNLLPNPNEV